MHGYRKIANGRRPPIMCEPTVLESSVDGRPGPPSIAGSSTRYDAGAAMRWSPVKRYITPTMRPVVTGDLRAFCVRSVGFAGQEALPARRSAIQEVASARA